jgi:putative radical SAM enzyme (TIGR03279 family)
MQERACHGAVVAGVADSSIAAEVGITPGDRIVYVDGRTMEDLIDYKFLTSAENLTITVLKPNGDVWEIEIEKEYDDDLGIEFTAATFDAMRRCANRCIFCFIDQNPTHLRESLYEYDDDYRLSFLYGQFITLTNLRERDWQRIAQLRLSPLYVSVHAMEPELRAKMLQSPRAAHIVEHLDFFKKHGIQIHAQVVLCPDINDGEHLTYTITQLAGFYPTVQSVAIVPAGITRFRAGLPTLRPLEKAEAKRLVESVEQWQAEYVHTLGTRFVWSADEIYVQHDLPLPDRDIYESLPQAENGVGLTRLFLQEAQTTLADMARRAPIDKNVSIITGVLGAKVLRNLVDQLQSLGAPVRMHIVNNKFFGESITATGLVTGGDIINQLAGQPLGDEVVIPEVMVRRHGAAVFLDGISVSQLESALGVPVRVLVGARELIEHLFV